MARVVGVYALVFVCVTSALIFAVTIWSYEHKSGDVFLVWSTIYRIPYIYWIDDTTGLTLKATEWENVHDYSWSPDGTLIAVVIYASVRPTYIEVRDSRGQKVAQITSENGIDSPSWMPDSETLVFASWVEGESQIFSTNIYDSQHWQWIMDREIYYWYMSLSPDGKTWSYMTYRDDPNYVGSLLLMPFEGGASREISAFARNPRWSPDSQSIVYTQSDLNANYEIVVLDVVSNVNQSLTTTMTYLSQPVWSPDGSQIAFIDYVGNDMEIFTMNADGTNMQQMTFNDLNEEAFMWMP